jgi:WhiB family transcriptional regulator, redox-sensing transcriptional regulator
MAMDIRRWARCNDGRGSFTHIFFSDDPVDIARAKAICAKCVVRVPCLAGALQRGEVWGVWGGEILVDGEVVAVKRRRGRPPVHPRPPLVVAEVPGEIPDQVSDVA